MYKVAIIGAGPAGIEAAKMCIKNNLDALLIEKNRESFGGTCLNSGCIPTKFYIHNLSTSSPSVLMEQKAAITEKIRSPLLKYLEKKIDIKFAEARLCDEHTIRLGETIIEAENILIATGSVPKEIIKTDQRGVIFAEDIFKEANFGRNNLIIGAGSVGLEVATILNLVAKSVEVIEKEDQILPFMVDGEIAQRLQKILQNKGIQIRTSTNIEKYQLGSYEKIINCAGRAPALKILDGAEINIEKDQSRFIKVDDYLRTNIPSIYACGDITGTHMYAYAAEYESRLAIENIAGSKVKRDYRGLPACCFTLPQVATVGYREQELKSSGLDYRVRRANFLGFSSSYVYADSDGFIKVLEAKDNTLLGVQIISRFAAELINIFSLCVREVFRSDVLRRALFIHPAMAEIASKIFHT